MMTKKQNEGRRSQPAWVTARAGATLPRLAGQWFGRRVLASLVALLPLASLTVPMTVQAAQNEITTTSVRTAENEAGNLVADAIRAVAGADIAFVPAAAFKPNATVPRPATPEQATGLVEPASDVVVVLNLRGDQILAALERSVSFAPQPSVGFLQVSGLRFNFDTRKESQKRVSNVTVNGQPLEAAKIYKVATTRPLGNGQQGYSRVWDRNSIASDTGKSLAAALTEFAKGGTLSTNADGRITIAN